MNEAWQVYVIKVKHDIITSFWVLFKHFYKDFPRQNMQPFIGFRFGVVNVNFNANQWLVKTLQTWINNLKKKLVLFCNKPWKEPNTTYKN
jgi:hypothetical protein